MKITILLTTLIAGTLDILAAFTHSYFTNDVMPSKVLMYIASGIMGNEAFSGGIEVFIIGLLAHYFIAFSCTVSFFWLYSKWQFLEKYIFLNSILIALVAWFVTTQVIIPLSKANSGGFDLSNASKAVAILIVCIGLPIAYSAKRYFNSNEQ